MKKERKLDLENKLRLVLKLVRGQQRSRNKLACKNSNLQVLKGKEANKCIKCISEAALNVVKGNVPISKRKLVKLHKYQQSLNHLAKKSKSLASKKRLLNQQGGALLPLLIPPVLGFLASLAAKKVSKVI